MRLRVAALAVLACLAAPARGAPRTVTYEAEIWSVPSELASVAMVGDPVTGRIDFDDATADAEPDPTEGLYPGVTHAFTLGAYSGVSTQSFLRIYDDGSMPAFDAWQVGDFSPGDELDPLAGLDVTQLFLVLNGGTTMFASDAIPPGLPPLGDPTIFEKEFRLEVNGSGLLRATITAVPAPGSGAGAAGAAATVGVLARRRRRAAG